MILINRARARVLAVSIRFAAGAAVAACSSSSADGVESAPVATVTWYQDIAPLVSENCSACHFDGGIAPFSLKSYDDAKFWSGAMAKAVESGTMPPFLAHETDECQPPVGWKADIRLSDSEIALIRTWADEGAPLGDSATAAPVVAPVPVELPRADVVLKLPAPIHVEGDTDLHICVVVDPKLAEDSHVTGRLIHSGNPKVLHHVVSYLLLPDGDETKAELAARIEEQKGVGIDGQYDCFGGPNLDGLRTQLLDAWAPGGNPNLSPEDSGQPIDKDALVVLDIHYHPTGNSAEVDSDTDLSLMLADTKPQFVARSVLLGNFSKGIKAEDIGNEDGWGGLLLAEGETEAEFVIPPNAEAHYETMTWTVGLPDGFKIWIYGAGTHMHYVGEDMKISLTHATPAAGEAKEECLIQTPQWDFEWQRGYYYDAPLANVPEVRNGDTITFRCRYNNSMSNPAVAAALRERGLDEPVAVRQGDDTLDEMCLGFLNIALPNLGD